MHSGEWARKAVSLIQADGGKMTLEDLAAYEVTWSEPIVANHGGYQVYAYNNEDGYGGVNMIEALNLAEAAGIAELGHWSRNPDRIGGVQNLLTAGNISFMPEGHAGGNLFRSGPVVERAAEPETAGELWRRMESGAVLMAFAQKPAHSDTVVAVDQWGNMTAVTHSINCVFWGRRASSSMASRSAIPHRSSSRSSLRSNRVPGSRPDRGGIDCQGRQPHCAVCVHARRPALSDIAVPVNVMDFGMTPEGSAGRTRDPRSRLCADWPGTARIDCHEG